MKYAPYRREQELSVLKSRHFPKRFLFIDTETKPVYMNPKYWFNVLYLGVAIFVEIDNDVNVIKREIYEFRSTAELLRIIAELSGIKKRLVIIGHNIAFDIEVLNLPAVFSELGCDNTYPIKNGMSFIWTVQTGRGSLLFIDTANYAATSLKQMGKDLGIPKMDIDFDNCSDSELLIYCQNDVEICEKFILEFIRFLHVNDMGEFRFTIASQALTAYRHKFMSVAPVFHNRDSVNEIEKYSYFGGRTEALFIGQIPDKPVYYLDVSSEYPAAMIAGKLPYQLLSINRRPIDKFMSYHLDHNYLIVECTVETPEPVFPMRAKITHTKEELQVELINNYNPQQGTYKIIYPVGTFKTWLHHVEFKYALEHNLIKEVHAYCVYKAADLFTEYINTLYKMKAEYSESGHKSFRLMTKYMMNSLYGKWGQEYHDTQLIGTSEYKTMDIVYGYSQRGGYTYTDINWFGKVYRTYQTGLSTFAFPAIAGAITAYARQILWNYRKIAGHDNVFYHDTDSLFCNTLGYKNLIPFIQDNRLGMLELKDSSDDVFIYGNKDYVFAGKETHKGIPEKHIELSAGTYEFMVFEGFTKWRNAGAITPPVTEIVTKKRHPIYDKGVLQDNGIVIPFEFSANQVVAVFPLAELYHRYSLRLASVSLNPVSSGHV